MQPEVLARHYDVALLDLDGVVYVGPSAVGHAPQALKAARAEGMRLAFVTNNAARPPAMVAEHLTDIGVEAFEHEVVTSAQAAASLLAGTLPGGARVLVVGGEGLILALREKGLVPVSSADDEPAAVVQGFAPDLSWRALAEGAYAIATGVPWVASNLDRTIPTLRGIAPGNGALVDTLRTATGREPVAAGKPEPPMHREAVVRTGAKRPLVVGDRLDTDIEGAVRAGVDSLLVMTGVTSPAELVLAGPHARPTYVGQDLRALHQAGAELSVAGEDRRRGEWTASVEDARLTLDGPSSPDSAGRLDALRAACAAVWNSPGDVDAGSVHTALGDVFEF